MKVFDELVPDEYKDADLYVISRVTDQIGFVRWVVIGRKMLRVDNETTRLMNSQGVEDSRFDFPRLISDASSPFDGWFISRGHTIDEVLHHNNGMAR